MREIVYLALAVGITYLLVEYRDIKDALIFIAFFCGLKLADQERAIKNLEEANMRMADELFELKSR